MRSTTRINIYSDSGFRLYDLIYIAGNTIIFENLKFSTFFVRAKQSVFEQHAPIFSSHVDGIHFQLLFTTLRHTFYIWTIFESELNSFE